jgi:hypothetical protein
MAAAAERRVDVDAVGAHGEGGERFGEQHGHVPVGARRAHRALKG